MDNIEVKQIINSLDDENFNAICKWMYEWWGKEEENTKEEIECYISHSFQKDKLPQTYGLFLNNKIIGCYQFIYDDFFGRPDLYPWLANVYIEQAYRGKGYGKYLLNTVFDNAKKLKNVNEIYLYTKHISLYEQFGWQFIMDFDTYRKKPRIQRLYKLNL